MSEIIPRTLVSESYWEIMATPFYQDGDIYRYARHLIIDAEDTSLSSLKEYVDDSESHEMDNHRDEIVESYQVITDTLNKLGEITIHKSEFEAWVLQRIKSKTLQKYAGILDMLYAQLVLISYKHGSWDARESDYSTDGDMMFDSIHYGSSRASVIDFRKQDDRSTATRETSDYVLNRKNPFADVSIKNQRFIYASDYNRFNALELRTSRKVTKVDKDENHSYITLQPGFNIRNSPRIEGGATSNIRFDDTLTSEITQDDDKTYIYLDAQSLSSE